MYRQHYASAFFFHLTFTLLQLCAYLSLFLFGHKKKGTGNGITDIEELNGFICIGLVALALTFRSTLVENSVNYLFTDLFTDLFSLFRQFENNFGNIGNIFRVEGSGLVTAGRGDASVIMEDDVSTLGANVAAW